MWEWPGVLALLALAWLLQCVGTWIQVRRYRAAFRELSSGWSDGWMGAGKGGRFPRAGAIALIVVAPEETVRRVVVMEGRTVFAKARRLEEFESLTVAELRARTRAKRGDALAMAVTAALDQVALVRANQEGRRSSMAGAEAPRSLPEPGRQTLLPINS